MKINKIQKYQQSYKGLHIDKLSTIHYDYIKPCIPKLQELAEKTDIFMQSRLNPQLHTEIIEYAVKPITTSDADKNILRWSCLGSGYTKNAADGITNKIIDAIKRM